MSRRDMVLPLKIDEEVRRRKDAPVHSLRMRGDDNEWEARSVILLHTPMCRLSDLVLLDHFYRYLERTLDLSFVREFAHETYAAGGRPSIDPVVFFKLQLVMFFEGLRN
jgi:transposase